MAQQQSTARQILQDIYGYSSFRSRQEQIIADVVAGRDVMTIMPTGGGKSLCYQIPSIIRPGVGIIISPLIALMKDQVDGLRQMGVRSAFINSSVSGRERSLIEAEARRGELDLLFVAPERFATAPFISFLQELMPALFAVDEAHCVSQWGHDFRPDYLRIAPVMQQFPDVPRMALTATADRATREDIVQRLGLRDSQRYIDSFDRPNIQYRIEPRGGNTRQRILSFIRTEFPGQSGIIYAGTRKMTDDYADWLQEEGISALPYHAGLSAEERTRNQERFARDKVDVIVATIAFGMGIDKPDIRYVIHLNLPKNVESYYQETGRAGRDGQPAIAWMLYSLQDVMLIRGFIEQSEADEAFKTTLLNKLQRLLGLCETVECRRIALLAYFDEALEQPCGNCDTCIKPPERWDGTVATKKLLSAIYRTGQRFGAGYLINLLRGKADDRMSSYGHDQLPTFGCGTEHSDTEWRSVIRQLMINGYIYSDMNRISGISITPKGIAALKSDDTIYLREDKKLAIAKKKKGKKPAADVSLDEEETKLYEELRSFRNGLAAKKGIPPYAVFHNKTLALLARNKPTEVDELHEISGFGISKVKQYGRKVLQVIKRYMEGGEDESLEESHSSQGSKERSQARWTKHEEEKLINLYSRGASSEELVEHLNRTAAALSSRLEKLARQGKVELRE